MNGLLGFADNFKVSNVSAAVVDAARAVGLALAGRDGFPTIGDWSAVNIRRQKYHHRIALASIVANNEYKFWNANYSPNICNLPQQGSIGGDAIAFITSLRFKLEQAYDITGAAVVAGEPGHTSASANVGTAATTAADCKIIFDNGLVNFKAGSRDLIKDCYGLYNFPAGGGADGGGWSNNTGTTSNLTSAFGQVNNGQPNSNNGYAFLPIPWVSGNDLLDLSLRFPFARTLAGALVAKFEMDTILISGNK